MKLPSTEGEDILYSLLGPYEMLEILGYLGLQGGAENTCLA